MTQVVAAGSAPHRREVLLAAVSSLTALSVPNWVQAVDRSAPGRTDASTQRVGRSQVEAARTMLRLLSAVDAAYGAGAARSPAADYLAMTIGPWLHAPANDGVRHDLFGVAAQLAYLCGFLCVDDELHEAAQRYYRIALRLSVEADDPIGYATTLRAMSVQAHTLHHHTRALDLAESAQAASTAVPAATRAFLVGQLALASAATGDRHRALTQLRTAERALDRAPHHSAVIGTHHQSSMAHQRAAICSRLGDRSAAIAALQHSIRSRPVTERRSRCITLAHLADLQLCHGRQDDAIASWHRFLDDYPGLGSGRVDSALATLRARVRPYATTHAAAALLHRAATLQQMRRTPTR